MKAGPRGAVKSHPLYQTWCSMIKRCEDPSMDSYKYYGAIGISVCSRWKSSFWSFVDDVGIPPQSGMTIDRYPDKKGPYAPNNFRWATKTEQMLNRRVFAKSVTGITGVLWVPRRGTFEVRIGYKRRMTNLGSTSDFFEACCLRKSSEAKIANGLPVKP